MKSDGRATPTFAATDMEPEEPTEGVEQLQAQENNNPIGVYGWRKRCLYFFVLLLVVVLLVNLGLTIWILVVLRFNVHGMGSLRITDNGLRLEGTADFIGPLYAETISADQDSSLLLQSGEEVGINVDGSSSISLNNNMCSITTPQLQLLPSSSATPALTIDHQGVSVGAEQLNVSGSLGLILGGPLETDEIRSPPEENLEVLSPSGRLIMTGSQGVRIEDGFGFDGIEVTAANDIAITSRNGVVSLDGTRITTPRLQRASSGGVSVYEVCACPNGELYLVAATSSCENNSICN